MSVMQSGILASLAQGESAVSMEPGTWSMQSTPAAAAQATTTRPADPSGGRHICRGIYVCIAANGTAQAPLQVVLRDGASGVGTILWSKKLSTPAMQTATVDVPSLSLVGSPGTAMTLEFVGAGAAATEQAITLTGVTLRN
jgi:hypothetical protein